MMLAYRRGLLKPDYPQGIRSMLRERMVLDMLEMELSADYFRNASLLAACAWAPSIDPKRAKEFASSLYRQLDHAASRAVYEDTPFHTDAEIDAQFTKTATEWMRNYKAMLAAREKGSEV